MFLELKLWECGLFDSCVNLKSIKLPNITIDQTIFGSSDWGSAALTNLTHIEYKGEVYTSIADFYAAL